MYDAMRHGDLDINSNPDALGYMCLSILHYLLHIFKHVWNIGIRWEIKVWKPIKYTEEQNGLMLVKKTAMKARYHLRFFVQVGHKTTYAAIENHNFFTKTCHRQTYQNY